MILDDIEFELLDRANSLLLAYLRPRLWTLFATEALVNDDLRQRLAREVEPRAAPTNARPVGDLLSSTKRRDRKDETEKTRPKRRDRKDETEMPQKFSLETWNDTTIHLIPVQVTGWRTLADALPD